MSDIDLAVTKSRDLEQLLESEFGAAGRGLHEKTSSVEARLPRALVRKLRLVATVRNKVVHEAGGIDDRSRFVDAADSAERELKAIVAARSGARLGNRFQRALVLLILLAIAAVAVFVYIRTR